MKTQRTLYHLIVDQSGSMSDCIEATITGFNEQLTSIRSIATEFTEQEIRVGLTLFNSGIKHLHIAQPAEEIPLLSRQNYHPRSNTALLDAIGQTSLLLSEKESDLSPLPTTFVVVILTDGYENSSRLFNLDQVRTMIKKLENTGKWTFSFIGATLDAVDMAREMSINPQNSYSFSKLEMKSAVWEKLSNSMQQYMHKKHSGGDITKLFDDKP